MALYLNSTQIPDVIFDEWMAWCSSDEFKVLMHLARRVYGDFPAECADVETISEATGLQRLQVKACAEALIRKGFASSVDGGDWYVFNREAEG